MSLYINLSYTTLMEECTVWARFFSYGSLHIPPTTWNGRCITDSMAQVGLVDQNIQSKPTTLAFKFLQNFLGTAPSFDVPRSATTVAAVPNPEHSTEGCNRRAARHPFCRKIRTLRRSRVFIYNTFGKFTCQLTLDLCAAKSKIISGNV